MFKKLFNLFRRKPRPEPQKQLVYVPRKMGRALAEIHQTILRELPDKCDIKTLESVASKYYTIKTIGSMIKKGYIEKTPDEMYRKKDGWAELVHRATITPITRRTKAQMQCREQDDMPGEEVQVDEQQDNDETVSFLDDNLNVVAANTTPVPAREEDEWPPPPRDQDTHVKPAVNKSAVKSALDYHLEALALLPWKFTYAEYSAAYNKVKPRNNPYPSIKPLLDRGYVKSVSRGQYERMARGNMEMQSRGLRPEVK